MDIIGMVLNMVQAVEGGILEVTEGIVQIEAVVKEFSNSGVTAFALVVASNGTSYTYPATLVSSEGIRRVFQVSISMVGWGEGNYALSFVADSTTGISETFGPVTIRILRPTLRVLLPTVAPEFLSGWLLSIFSVFAATVFTSYIVKTRLSTPTPPRVLVQLRARFLVFPVRRYINPPIPPWPRPTLPSLPETPVAALPPPYVGEVPRPVISRRARLGRLKTATLIHVREKPISLRLPEAEESRIGRLREARLESVEERPITLKREGLPTPEEPRIDRLRKAALVLREKSRLRKEEKEEEKTGEEPEEYD